LLIGTSVYYLCFGLGKLFELPFVPAQPPSSEDVQQAAALIPNVNWSLVWQPALEKLPVILPFALATIVGGIDCTESAAAAGDEFDTSAVLFTEGVASLAAGLFGGVLQNTPYIGHPAYKAMGSRAAYTLATGLFVGATAYLGLFPYIFNALPHAAMFPILVFVGIEITAQSFHATPAKYYPAVAFAILPALAALATILIGMVLGRREPEAAGATVLQTLRCLYNGFIVTSLLWGAAVASMIDGRLRLCAGYLGVAAVFTWFGIMHSPLPDAVIDLPHEWH
jgi:AGZA family xanthine/uracil permease-like MFS transporter